MTVDEIIHKYSEDISKKITTAAKTSSNEAEFRSKVTKVIEDFADIPEVAELINLRLNPPHEEYTLIRGSADVVYNRFVIEYESPGTLRISNSYRTNDHSLKQVKTYIEDLHKLEKHKIDRIAGVVLDGHYYIFVRWKEERWSVDEPLPVTPSSTEQFLRYLSSLSTEIALTPEYLIRDFGENTVVSRLCVSTFYDALVNTTNPKVQTLFNQWNLQFSEVCGYEEGSTRFDVKELAKKYGVKDPKPNTFKLFFCIHTYYATFIKLLAIQIASYYAFPGTGTALQKVASFSSQELTNYLKKMERGGIFKDFGINNFLEGDFFGWYLDIWNELIDKAVRRIISELANYSLITLDVDPEETRDLLKKLYQNLMPRDLRHNLGEYYTPDWLAERLLVMLCGKREGNKADVKPDMRILDPACGSGTFLVIAIKRIREYAKDKNISERELLEKILENMVGFDLNPLAVISARTNYLLAIGDLLQHRTKEINIPVYLCDSIMTPREGEDIFGKGILRFNTAVGPFSVPKSLIQARYIDILSGFLEESVSLELNQQQFIEKLCQKLPLDKTKDEKDINVVYNLYEKLLSLQRQGINGIWARIIKNAFAPLFVGEFDYVAGNPPWVNWESLPENYRADSQFLWIMYGMAATKGRDKEQFELGKQKRDISTLMTYVSIDKYLNKGGKLGFIITQSVFKTNASATFRKFKLPDGLPIQVLHVDDMVELNPFEGATNRTSVVILQKGRSMKYPMPSYLYWRKSVKGKSVSLEATLEEVIQFTERKQFVAEPVDIKDSLSPWITGRPKALAGIKKIRGESDYKAHEGVNTGGANGVFWVDIIAKRSDDLVTISNITEGAKRKVENMQSAIEPDLLYPLLRGRDIEKWKANASAWIILPHTPKTSWQAIPEEDMKVKYSKTYLYLKKFEDVLKNRSAYRLLRKGHPFYICVDIHTETFVPYKIVWRYISTNFNCSVIEPQTDKFLGKKIIVPDCKLIFIWVNENKEAHYLCAILNSSAIHFFVISHMVTTQIAPYILQHINISKFNPENVNHIKLSELSQEAHKAAIEGDEDEVKKIEEKIDHYAAKLWGLTEQELKDIKDSLKEMNA